MGPVNMRIQKSPRSKSIIVHIDKIKKVLGPTPMSWLREGESGELRGDGGGVVGEVRDDLLEQNPKWDEADSTPNCALRGGLEKLAEVALPGVPGIIDPTPARLSRPKAIADVPQNTTPTIGDRPRRDIKKPARFLNRITPSCEKEAYHLAVPPTDIGNGGGRSPLPRRNLAGREEVPPYWQLCGSGSWNDEAPSSSCLQNQLSVEGLYQDSGCWMSVEWGNFGPLDGQLIGTLVLAC